VREIKPLTGLRFIAAFSILNGHFAVTASGADGGANLPLQLPPGMPLFFCLSGFVLTWTYAERLDLRRFYWARFARIYPLFAVLFVVYALVGGLPRHALWSHVFLLQAWSASPGFFDISWSLSVEAFFYACFPAVALLLARCSTRSLAWVAAGALATSVAVGLLAYFGLTTVNQALIFPPSRFPDFVFGCVMARLALRGVRAPRWLLPATLLALLAARQLVLPKPLNQDPLFLAPVGLLMLSLATRESVVGRVLGNRALLRLGAASYALYLVHPLIRQAAWSLFGPVLPLSATLAGMTAAIAVSFVLYRVIEEPARRRLRLGLAAAVHVDEPEGRLALEQGALVR
jgi:peptidoglycan/LPS O-acetylase OafA/YrhL